MFSKPNHARIRSQVDAIMAKNRGLYGGWTMSITPAEPAPGAAPAVPATTEPPKPTEPPAAATTPPATAPEAPAKSVWDDPVTAKAEGEKLRRENAKDRTTAKAQAAEDAKKEFAQSIGKMLGLVEDDANDPAKLTASLTTAQTEAKQARVELAVFRSAGTAGGDPLALLDSSSFLKSLDGIDPADSAAVTAAITAAVTANPRLGAAPGTPQAPAPNPAQGSSGAPGMGFDAAIAAAQAKGDHLTVIQLRQQKSAAERAQK